MQDTASSSRLTLEQKSVEHTEQADLAKELQECIKILNGNIAIITPKACKKALEKIIAIVQKHKLSKHALIVLEKYLNNENKELRDLAEAALNYATQYHQQFKPSAVKSLQQISSSAPVVVTRQQQLAKYKLEASHTLDKGLACVGKIQKKEITRVKNINLQHLPEIPDQGDNLSWYKTAYGKITTLSELAHKKNTLMKKDLDYIINLWQNPGFMYTNLIQARIIETLRCIAQNKQKLPEKAIDILQEALTFSNSIYQDRVNIALDVMQMLSPGQMLLLQAFKQGYYNSRIHLDAILAITIAACNGQLLPENIIALTKKVAEGKRDDTKFIEVPILIMAAKNGLALSDAELATLMTAMNVLDIDAIIKIYPKAPEKTSLILTGSHFSWYELSTVNLLKKLKKLAKKQALLTKEDLLYVVDCWENPGSDLLNSYHDRLEVKKLAIEILALAASNGQELPPIAITVLESILSANDITSYDKRIQNLAIFGLGCMRNNGFSLKDSALNAFKDALIAQSIDIVAGLTLYIDKYKLKEFNKEKLIAILNGLVNFDSIELWKNAFNALQVIAYYEPNLNCSLIGIDKVLADPKDEKACLSATQTLLNAVQQGITLADNIKEILGKALTDSYSLDVRRNIAKILYCYVHSVDKNNKQLPPSTLAAIEKNLCDENIDSEIQEYLIDFYGNYTLKYANEVVSDILLRALSNILVRKDSTRVNASFAIKNIIEYTSVKSKLIKELPAVFLSLCRILKLNDSSDDVKQNAVLALAHAARNELALPEFVLLQLADIINSCTDENVIRPALSALAECAKHLAQVIFPDAVLSSLANLLIKAEPEISHDASVILSRYIKNVKQPIKSSIFELLIKHLNGPMALDISDILKSHERYIEEGHSLSILEKLSAKLRNGLDDEVVLNIASTLSLAAKKRPLSNVVANNVQHLLVEDLELQALQYIVISLRLILTKNKEFILEEYACEVLAELIANPAVRIKIRKNAVLALVLYSERHDNLSIKLLDNLKQTLINSASAEIRKNLVKIFHCYIKHNYQNKSINSKIEDYLTLLEQYVNDKDIIDEILGVLADAIALGYNFHNKETIRILDNVLLSYPVDTVRDSAKTILLSIQKRHSLSKTTQTLLAIEACAENLSKIEYPITERFINAIITLKNYVQKKNTLSINCVLAIREVLAKTVIQKGTQKYINAIAKTMYMAAENGQTFNLEFVDLLGKALLQQLNNTDCLIQALDKLTAQSHYIPVHLVAQLEDILSHQKPDKHILSIIKLGAEKGYTLQLKTLEICVELLQHTDRDIRAYVAKICYSATQNKQALTAFIINQLEYALNSQDANVAYDISLCFSLMPPAYLDSDKLYKILKHNPHLKVQHNLLAALENSNKPLSEEIQQFISLKKQQAILTDPNARIEVCLQAIEQIMESALERTIRFAALDKACLNNHPQVRDSALAAIVEISVKANIPHSTIAIIESVIDNHDEGKIIIFLLKAIEQGHIVTDKTLKYLERSLNSEQTNIAAGALKILQKIDREILTDDLRLRLEIEEAAAAIESNNADKLNSIHKIAKAARSGFPLSSACQVAIISLFKQKHNEFATLAIEIFCDLEKFNYPLPKTLFHYLTTQLGQRAITDKKAVQLIVASVTNSPLGDIVPFVRSLERYFYNDKTLGCAISILYHFIERDLIPRYIILSEKALMQLANLTINSLDNNISYQAATILNYFAKNDQQLTKNVIAKLYSGISATGSISAATFKALSGGDSDKSQHVHTLRLNILNRKKIVNDQFSKRLQSLQPAQYDHFIVTLLKLKFLNRDVFDAEPQLWCRKLLCAELIKRTNCSNLSTKRKFYRYLEELERENKYAVFSQARDRILELIIQKQAQYGLSLIEVNKILILSKGSHDKAILYLANNNDDKRTWLEDIRFKWLSDIFNANAAKKVADARHIKRLLQQFDDMQWDLATIDILAHSVKDTDLFEKIAEFMDFCLTHKVSKDMIQLLYGTNTVSSSTDIWKRRVYEQLIIETLSESNAVTDTDISAIINKVTKLLSLGWSFSSLYQLLKRFEINDENTIQNLLDSLDICIYYQLSEKHLQDKLLLSIPVLKHWLNALHRLAIDSHFNDQDEEKSLDRLLQEIATENKTVIGHYSNLNSSNYMSIIKNVTKYYWLTDPITKIAIKDWNSKQIQQWAQQIKENRANDVNYLPEILAVIQRAIVLHSGYEPRSVQLLAVLLLLDAKEQGRLLQVATGEGKSLTIAILAVVKALQGKKIDIITSSPLLAKRDADEKRAFYKMFNLEVANNCDEEYSGQGLKKCYASNITIVYGDASNFQFDILREEYSLLGTRGERKFCTAIVDEVDSMLLDDSNKIAMLATAMPGMEQLEPLLILIWQELERVERHLKNLKDGLYWVNDQNFDVLNGELLPKVALPVGYQPFVRKVDDLNEFLSEHLIEYMHNILKSNRNESLFKIPLHLQAYVKTQLATWVDNAIIAKHTYELNHHYIITTDAKGAQQITPVDYANTGITQANTNWGDGLHQFLQIKHGLRLTPEKLITNFLSNMSYIKRYGKALYGLTGTIGSEQSIILLAKIYQVDIVKVPRYKYKQFIEMPGIVAGSKSDWLKAIITHNAREIKHGRATLIICETIKQAKIIYQEFSKIRQARHIKLYTRSDSEERNTIETVADVGDVIIATNLAGRGTDIKTTAAVEQNGGLHVSVTFLPVNSRVEEQAFGRTSRQGKRGTAQLVLNNNKINKVFSINEANPSIEQIRAQRDSVEMMQLDKIKSTDLKQVQIKDELFKRFCILLKELQLLDKAQNTDKNIIPKQLEDNTLIGSYIKNSKQQYKRAAVEERWGLWLKEFLNKLDLSTANLPLVARDTGNEGSSTNGFETFRKQVLADYATDTIIKNPCYYINQANGIFAYSGSLRCRIAQVKEISVQDKLYETAIKLYSKAIELDPIFAYNAYYNSALVEIKRGESLYQAGIITSNSDMSYKQRAKDFLRSFINIMSECILRQLESIDLQLSLKQSGTINNPLPQIIEQSSTRINLVQIQIESARRAIVNIEKSQKLIDISCTPEKRDYYKLTENQALDIIQKSNQSKKRVSVTFHDLKVHKDITTKYQAKNTIERTPNIAKISIALPSMNRYLALDSLPIHQKSKIIGFKLQLKYKTIPSDDQIEPGIIYLYMAGRVMKFAGIEQYAVTNKKREISRIIIDRNDIPNDYEAITEILNDPSESLLLSNDQEKALFKVTARHAYPKAILPENLNKQSADITKQGATLANNSASTKQNEQSKEERYRSSWSRWIDKFSDTVNSAKEKLDPLTEKAKSLLKKTKNQIDKVGSKYIKGKEKIADWMYQLDEAMELMVNVDIERLTFQQAASLLDEMSIAKGISVASKGIDIKFNSLSKEFAILILDSIEIELIACLIPPADAESYPGQGHAMYCDNRSQVREYLQSNYILNELSFVLSDAKQNEQINLNILSKACKLINKIQDIIKNNIVKTVQVHDLVDSIINSFFITLQFTRLTQREAALLISSTQSTVRLKFDDLNKKVATKIVYLNESSISDATICIKDLLPQKAINLIKHADRKEQRLDYSIRPIEAVFLNSDRPMVEVYEAKSNGLLGLLELNEQNPIPWRSVSVSFGLGMTQLVTGGMLSVFSLGLMSHVGGSLIAEGISDIVIAIRGCYSRRFDWQEYSLQKTISLTITLMTVGITRWKAVKECAEAGKSIAVNKLAIEFVEEGMNLAKRKIMVAVCEAGARESITSIVDTFIPYLLNTLKPQVVKVIEDRISEQFCHPKFKAGINRILFTDMCSGNKNSQSELEQKIDTIIDCRNNRLMSATSAIFTGVVLNQLPELERFKQIFDAAGALAKIGLMTADFNEELTHSLSTLCEDLPELESLLQRFDLNQDDIKQLDKLVKAYMKNSQGKDSAAEVKLEENDSPAKIINNQFYSYRCTQQKQLYKKMTQTLISKVMRTIEGQLLKLITTQGIKSLVHTMSNKIQRSLDSENRTVDKSISRFHEKLKNARQRSTIIPDQTHPAEILKCYEYSANEIILLNRNFNRVRRLGIVIKRSQNTVANKLGTNQTQKQHSKVKLIKRLQNIPINNPDANQAYQLKLEAIVMQRAQSREQNINQVQIRRNVLKIRHLRKVMIEKIDPSKSSEPLLESKDTQRQNANVVNANHAAHKQLAANKPILDVQRTTELPKKKEDKPSVAFSNKDMQPELINPNQTGSSFPLQEINQIVKELVVFKLKNIQYLEALEANRKALYYLKINHLLRMNIISNKWRQKGNNANLRFFKELRTASELDGNQVYENTLQDLTAKIINGIIDYLQGMLNVVLQNKGGILADFKLLMTPILTKYKDKLFTIDNTQSFCEKIAKGIRGKAEKREGFILQNDESSKKLLESIIIDTFDSYNNESREYNDIGLRP